MNKNYFFVFIAASTIGGLAFTKMSTEVEISKFAASKAHKFSSTPPTGMTGAPGESNCTSCHGGTVQDGTSINQLVLLDANQTPVTEYTPGATYSVAISTEAASKRGFQVSARVLSNNTQAGTASAIAGVSSVQTANSQQYVNHNATSNTLVNGWLYNWVAPSTDVGDVRFYLVTNKTNSNSASSGDVIRTSQHTFSAVQSSASVNEKSNEKVPFTVGFNASSHSLSLNFNAQENASFYINLVDLSGKSVMSKLLSDVKTGANSQKISLPEGLTAGMYVLNFFEDNKSSSKKVYISK